MCSIAINQTADRALNALKRKSGGKTEGRIEARLAQFAKDASPSQPGGLDDPSDRLQHMPSDLRDVSHKRIGKHRVYFVGHHTKCNYFVFHVKPFKREGVDSESDKDFQERLRRSLADGEARELEAGTLVDVEQIDSEVSGSVSCPLDGGSLFLVSPGTGDGTSTEVCGDCGGYYAVQRSIEAVTLKAIDRPLNAS